MKKIYMALEKMASCMVGTIFAVLTWDAWLAALLTDGWLRMLFRLTLRKRKAARRAGTR